MSEKINIAVLGDSSPWGQGLLEEHKYVNQIGAELCQTPATDLFQHAHSGAIIGVGFEGSDATADGEVPVPSTIIMQQVDEVPNPETIGLVLINGGLNDVDLRKILDPVTKSNSLREATSNACYRDMKILLLKAASVFCNPKCRFVVTGYYPILSPNSNLKQFDGVDAFRHLLKVHGLGLPLFSDHDSVLKHVCSLSMQFWKDSNEALIKAVAEARSLLSLRERMWFVPCPLTERNALFAEQPWLFAFDSNLAPEDEVANRRATACDLHYLSFFQRRKRKTCHYASLGHPNVVGSREIGISILNSI